MIRRSKPLLLKLGVLILLIGLLAQPAWRLLNWGYQTTTTTLDIVKLVHHDFPNIGYIELGNSSPLFQNRLLAKNTLGVYVLLTDGIEYNFVWYKLAKRLVFISEGWVNQAVANGFSDSSPFV
ncbi:hypothetical protein [Alicyclobacillus acidiphilus]|uniref:hypothetical protein n=1 Tax=Alicyclobacillus acidiphilus TaxID=182455 RepID=UPI0008367232|nr:hypothetical protein [Alicyclobacillus acidiphilus]